MPTATQGPTATVFNHSLWPQPQGETTPPPGLRSIAIVGGGSAGWMAAMILADSLGRRGVEITVLESPSVEIIGVGEGSTPWMRGFFDALGIEESEWMPEVNATYKCGITFDRWSTKPGFESYFHPFASMLDNLTLTQFTHNANARLRGADVHAHPDRFFISSYLAQHKLAPKPAASFPFDIWYGYHFDAVLLGKYLGRKAQERGVRYKSCHIADVKLDEQGGIAALTTREGETITADFFLDCTGFASVLIGKALKTPFVSFAENLFNDSAVAMPTPIGERVSCQTVSTAMRHGWRWEIPLANRYGNGYVYSSSHCSADEAERELRESIGMLDDPTPARHLKMRIGRVTQHWNRNCLAVGLSQGFIEPLEATALLFIQRTVQNFVEYAAAGRLDTPARDEFNRRMNEHFEGTRDYIVTHYKTNSRTDTEYWRANAANGNLSDPLKELYRLWLSGKGFAKEVGSQAIGKGYPVFSWYAILAGTGCFPPNLRAPTASEARYDLAEIDAFIRRSGANFRDHRAALNDIAPRSTERSLQVYFW